MAFDHNLRARPTWLEAFGQALRLTVPLIAIAGFLFNVMVHVMATYLVGVNEQKSAYLYLMHAFIAVLFIMWTIVEAIQIRSRPTQGDMIARERAKARALLVRYPDIVRERPSVTHEEREAALNRLDSHAKVVSYPGGEIGLRRDLYLAGDLIKE